jgi:uncharacterized RDD family membrane protein YckC
MRHFSARETEWLLELDGIELARFWPRAFAFVIDWVIVGVAFSVLASAVAGGAYVYLHRQGKSLGDVAKMVGASEDGKDVNISIGPGPKPRRFKLNEHTDTGEAIDLVTKLMAAGLYFGILLYKGEGRTPGKRLMKIRVVSIVHRKLSFWHCVERALGYGAAALEGGFGFYQFFLHPYHRCAQDRLAETIVVTERGYQGMVRRRERVRDGVGDSPRLRTNSEGL